MASLMCARHPWILPGGWIEMKLSWWIANKPLTIKIRTRAILLLDKLGDVEVPADVNSIEKFVRWMDEKDKI